MSAPVSPPSGRARPALSGFLARMVWLAMLPLLVLSVWLAWGHVRALDAAEDRAANALAADTATSLDQFLNARIRGLTMLAVSPLADDTRGWPALYREAEGFQQSFGSHVILADNAFHMLFNTRAPLGESLPSLPTPRPQGRAAAPQALATGLPAVGDIIQGPVAGVPLVAIAVPGLRQGKPAFLLLTTVETRRIGERLGRIPLPEGWGICLRDGAGDLIAQRGAPEACAPAEGSWQRITLPMNQARWTVQVDVPRARTRWALVAAASALAAGILLATLAGWLGARLAGRRLTHCVGALADPVAEGEDGPDIAEFARVKDILQAGAQARARAEAELKHSEERFRRLFQQAPLALGHVGHDGRIIAQNARFEALFGHTLEDMPTLAHWWGLAYPDPAYREKVRVQWQAAVARAADSGTDIEVGEYQIACKDGSRRTVLISGIVMEDGVLSSFTDVTERKQAEQRLAETQEEALEFQRQGRLAALNQMEDANVARRAAEAASNALRESQERLQLFIEHAPASLAMFDRSLRYLAVSQRWKDDYSLEGAEIIGRCHYDVFPEIGEDWKEVHRRGLAGEVVRADMDRFERDDGTVQWLRWEMRPWHAADGTVGGIVIFSEDMTRYQAAQDEIRQLNAGLEQRVAERTAELSAANRELDTFAYAVSHDLRAPLRAMSGFSRALVEDFGASFQGESREYLDQIDIAARRMGELIDGILALSRSTRGELRRDEVDVSALCRRILAEMARGEPDRPVRARVEDGLSLRGDGRMMEAALRNLLGNAWKYTGHKAQEEAEIRVHGEQRDGRLWFCVSDNGAGFDMAYAARLFQPFQRLHRQDEFPGLGIGLATVQRIMHRHGGVIEARGEPGKGATFCFTLAPSCVDNASREEETS